MKHKACVIKCATTALASLGAYHSWCQNEPLTHFEGYHLAQPGPYPFGANSLDWFPDDYEVQGVTNDGQNWFFTLTDQDETTGVLWKIPKEVPLDGDVASYPGVMHIELDSLSLTELYNLGAWHWGDLDFVEYLGVGYLVVPIYQRIAVFRADDLSYVNWSNFPNNGGGGWCAVGNDLNLYGSTNDPNAITRFFVDWDGLLFEYEHDALYETQEYPMTESDGVTPLQLTDMQGGEFSPTGEMLYLVSGRGRCLFWGEGETPQDGIHAIRTDTWTRMRKSVRTSNVLVPFRYNYDPTCIMCDILGVPTGAGSETPEGLTIWALQDGSAPYIEGTLHVLVDRYTFAANCNDELFLHHYSPIIHIDTEGAVLAYGTSGSQFDGLTSAQNFYPDLWNGATLSFDAGVYGDTGFINQRVRLISRNGTALIGQE
jgi:hypothetical protein